MSFMYEWVTGALLIEVALNTAVLIVWLLSVAIDGVEKVKLRTIVFGELAIAVFSFAVSMVATLLS